MVPMKWDTTLPINYLPTEISNVFSTDAKYLLNDLHQYKLQVALFPAPKPKHECHMIRVAINKNPEWYKELYHSKNHIRRKSCINALERISKYEDREFRGGPYLYDYRMREIIFDKLYNGIDYSGLKVDGDSGIITFFDTGIIDSNYFEYSKVRKLDEIEAENEEDYCPF